MKKKYQTYVLVIAVLIIWGIVAHTLFSSTLTRTEDLFEIIKGKELVKKEENKIEKFSISASYRDPFLGVVKRVKKKKAKKIEKPKLVFPRIQYTGLLSGAKESIYIIKINNVQFFYKVSNINKEVKLIEADRTKVLVEYKNEQKTYNFKK